MLTLNRPALHSSAPSVNWKQRTFCSVGSRPVGRRRSRAASAGETNSKKIRTPSRSGSRSSVHGSSVVFGASSNDCPGRVMALTEEYPGFCQLCRLPLWMSSGSSKARAHRQAQSRAPCSAPARERPPRQRHRRRLDWRIQLGPFVQGQHADLEGNGRPSQARAGAYEDLHHRQVPVLSQSRRSSLLRVQSQRKARHARCARFRFAPSTAKLELTFKYMIRRRARHGQG